MSKHDGTKVITVRKGCKNGNDYVKILVDGQEKPIGYTLSRELTGLTGEYGYGTGVFTISSPREETLEFGNQRTTLDKILPSEFQGVSLSFEQSTPRYAEVLRARILAARKWVQEQDFDTEESFAI
jgi:hypothetical protein